MNDAWASPAPLYGNGSGHCYIFIQRDASGETQSAQYSIALFVASDATDTWQSCCETVTQGCVTLWSEPAASIFR